MKKTIIQNASKQKKSKKTRRASNKYDGSFDSVFYINKAPLSLAFTFGYYFQRIVSNPNRNIELLTYLFSSHRTPSEQASKESFSPKLLSLSTTLKKLNSELKNSATIASKYWKHTDQNDSLHSSESNEAASPALLMNYADEIIEQLKSTGYAPLEKLSLYRIDPLIDGGNGHAWPIRDIVSFEHYTASLISLILQLSSDDEIHMAFRLPTPMAVLLGMFFATRNNRIFLYEWGRLYLGDDPRFHQVLSLTPD